MSSTKRIYEKTVEFLLFICFISHLVKGKNLFLLISILTIAFDNMSKISFYSFETSFSIYVFIHYLSEVPLLYHSPHSCNFHLHLYMLRLLIVVVEPSTYF